MADLEGPARAELARQPPPSKRPFAMRLDRLFRQVHPGRKAEYTYEEVAHGATRAGFDISPAYVWQLRNGKRANPTLRHIEGLAAFFGVSPGYFLDAQIHDRVDPDLELAAALRDAGVRQLAMRAHGLSPDALAALQDMVEHVRRLEGVTERESDP